jgi:hypothetical protein
MNLAFTKQKFQDWFTQQWVIFWGRRINPLEHSWLIGPYGELNGIGEDFIYQLAKKESLIVNRNAPDTGLISSLDRLNLPAGSLSVVSAKVIDFYEHTSNYTLKFGVQWNPVFRLFGWLVNLLFSRRINQLNIPISNTRTSEDLSSEIIQLVNPITNICQYTIWLRKFASTGKVVYSGIYGTCTLPSGLTCIKAVFPLPMGNATVILKPCVGQYNELILESSGEKFGDAGFYFLLKDSQGNDWAQYVSSFKDSLVVREVGEGVAATQTLQLWKLRVARFSYEIKG